MKNILVPMNDSEGLPSMLASAGLVANAFESYIEGLRVRIDSSAVLAADDLGAASPALLENFEREEAERSKRVRSVFEDFVRQRHEAAPSAEAPRWVQTTSPRGDIGSYGRVFDLIVVGRPTRSRESPAMGTLEAALFESGRPILIAPPMAPAGLGREVVIAWNGSTETARTIALGMPFLERAERVTVLTIEGGTVPGPAGEEVARSLYRHGIQATATTVSAGRRLIGEAILAEAGALGADLLLKGGYTQSRLRQMIFGGATSHILAEATLPVFMAH